MHRCYAGPLMVSKQGRTGRFKRNFWWRVCSTTKAYCASFWQGFARQMYAKVLRTSSRFLGFPFAALPSEQLAPRGAAGAVTPCLQNSCCRCSHCVQPPVGERLQVITHTNHSIVQRHAPAGLHNDVVSEPSSSDALACLEECSIL